MSDDTLGFLSTLHPYDSIHPDDLADLIPRLGRRTIAAGQPVYRAGEILEGLFILRDGEITVSDDSGALLSTLKPGNSFGERGLLRSGHAVTTAEASSDATVLVIPADLFSDLVARYAPVARFFRRGPDREVPVRPNDLTTTPVAQLMSRDPAICTPDTTVGAAAKLMAEKHISSLCVVENERLVGIVTIRDMSNRVVGDGRGPETAVGDVMTPSPLTLPPTAIGSDVLHMMMERHIGHVPIAEAGRALGIVTQTDLIRTQAVNSAWLVGDIAVAGTAQDIAATTGRIPELLSHLVGAGNRHDVVTRLITDIADAATRRLLALAEEKLGPPPAPYLWLACGSQGRREQTGVSDQDNCLFLDNAVRDADLPYFDALAEFVTNGLNTAGYVFCPGDMMASNPRWRQPVRVWESYFDSWIASPNPEAQMLASVMFDLRPIGGEIGLFEALHRRTLEAASKNSIFVAHMVANSLKHRPPLGLLKGFAMVRSGEHKNTIDMKMSGVVPVVDLGRLYALMGRIEPVNTRARLEMAGDSGAVSKSGGQDMLDAYDLIASTRLEHQARQIAAGGKPDNFLRPADLSDFERSHLRDAFVVVRTMQSAVGQGRGTVM